MGVLTPIIYPPTLFDTATRQKALPSDDRGFRLISFYGVFKKSTFFHTKVLSLAARKLALYDLKIYHSWDWGWGGWAPKAWGGGSGRKLSLPIQYPPRTSYGPQLLPLAFRTSRAPPNTHCGWC